MATLSVRAIAAECLGKPAPRSLLRDIFGVYGSNPQPRSLRTQLDLIQNKRFIRVAIVTILTPGSTGGSYSGLQQDLDSANQVFQRECNVWIYCVAAAVASTNLLGSNGILNQDDCVMGGFLGIGGHSVSDEEDELFDLGRGLGAQIVCYYLPNGSTDTTLGGCAAHPDGRRGFWVAFGASQWMFAHELGHVMGLEHEGNRSNLMWSAPGRITFLPPDLSGGQCTEVLIAGIGFDNAVEKC